MIIIVALSACEKHDGVYYAKQKCEIILDGKTYIDQPVLSIMGSSYIPGFQTQNYWYNDESDGSVKWTDPYVSFTTMCAPKRGAEWEIGIDAAIFKQDIIASVGEPIEFRLDKSQDVSEYESYRKYCIFNGVNYAVIYFRQSDTAVFVDSGTLTISTMTGDDNLLSCTGTFEFKFELDGKQHKVTGKYEKVPCDRL